jgi:hypothetical protein
MIKSGAKVNVQETEQGLIISISPELKPWQGIALGGWLLVWVFCGVFTLLGALKGMTEDQSIFYLVFAAFWIYFFFYATRSLLWSNFGVEYIELNDEALNYKRSWNSIGRVRNYQLENIKNLGLVNYGDNKFARSYSDAFWTIGGESVGFDYFGGKVVFALKVDERGSIEIVRKIEKAIRQSKK